ncbi:hypothetical protein L1987_15960 [Smallanthus sonchifolius]|uniref:Uncharacterized protein n=1 Tax=Smallanthus sonchifolius TaxID=185202 RepID=A0ACB9JAH7_9ASTR|nr:hypothetical protein L1987_15960 [Smallanthus sonchifolius]
MDETTHLSIPTVSSLDSNTQRFGTKVTFPLGKKCCRECPLGSMLYKAPSDDVPVDQFTPLRVRNNIIVVRVGQQTTTMMMNPSSHHGVLCVRIVDPVMMKSLADLHFLMLFL